MRIDKEMENKKNKIENSTMNKKLNKNFPPKNVNLVNIVTELVNP